MNKQRLIYAEELKNQFKDYVAIGDKRFVEGMLHYRNIALEVIDNAPTIEAREQWISVKDRLPEDSDEFVLVIATGIVNRNRSLINAFELACYCTGEGWILENYPECKNIKVTYWQPLPEPPQMDKETGNEHI